MSQSAQSALGALAQTPSGRITAAIASGILFGLAHPPGDLALLIWVALVPLLVVIRCVSTPLAALRVGSLAGFVAFLLTAYPLASAHLWHGWVSGSTEAIGAMQTRQWWFLHALWLAVASWIGLCWGLFAFAWRWMRLSDPATVVVVPALWILIPEWFRSVATWGFQWGFVGYAAGEAAPILPLAAFGGVWMLSFLVLFVGAVVAVLLAPQSPAARQRTAVVAGLALAATVAYGLVQGHRRTQEEGYLPVAAIQHPRERYTDSDFMPYGLDREYRELAARAAETNPTLVVLPESVSSKSLSLDGSRLTGKPAELQNDLDAWNAGTGSILFESEAALVVGLDTVEDGELHNTMVAWQGGLPVGWYHKRMLVPFAERPSRVGGANAIRGRTWFTSGTGPSLLETNQLRIGVFICQEVQYPRLVRDSVLAGADLLVSGGNDGVFADPAVARMHARMAVVRATEAGRYLVRSMKSGVSAILAPNGRTLAQLEVGESGVIHADVAPQTKLTPYVRFGDWVVVAAFVLVSASVFGRWGRS